VRRRFERCRGDATLQEQIPGVLVGVGPTQQSLIVEFSNAHISGCGILSVTPSVVETSGSVAVSLEATEDVLAPGEACPLALVEATVTVPLSAPLDGRAVTGIHVGSGALGPGSAGLASLVGLSPRDARLMLTPPGDGVPPNQHPFGLIVHHTHHAGAGPLPRVIAQQPAAGKPLHGQHAIVILTVAP
jgi:hypothetical protein